ncbi:type I-E CRISPR-associated protein Cas5/CasD [Streptomyces sp. NPDC015345]|uniref:type I-E CRISPR-associated protein Cas5/CasD n=1 Tax=Streptomyces sp. NPDC015345 TaxID=3364953 RepID=UPI0036F9E2DF
MSTRTLLLRLAAPLQAWGDHRGQIERRHTQPLPTKSGVIGLLAAALGHDRDTPLGDIAHLRMGVRADLPGTLLRDFHTASDYCGKPLPSAKVNAKGIQTATSPPKYTLTSERFYLQDAAFLVALEGPAQRIEEAAAAIANPVYPLSLGRRSCPPTYPLFLCVADLSLDEALARQPWLASAYARQVWAHQHGGEEPAKPPIIHLHTEVEDEAGDTDRTDQPLTYQISHTRHTTRRVRALQIPIATGWDPDPDTDQQSDHDPLALLGW